MIPLIHVAKKLISTGDATAFMRLRSIRLEMAGAATSCFVACQHAVDQTNSVNHDLCLIRDGWSRLASRMRHITSVYQRSDHPDWFIYTTQAQPLIEDIVNHIAATKRLDLTLTGDAVPDTTPLPLSQLLYVSDAKITSSWHVAVIAEQSRIWNGRVGITGALIHTDRHFVQYIEGAKQIVSDMAYKLASDDRHANMRIIETASNSKRRFATWNLAYAGPDEFIDGQLLNLMGKDFGQAEHDIGNQVITLLISMSAI